MLVSTVFILLHENRETLRRNAEITQTIERLLGLQAIGFALNGSHRENFPDWLAKLMVRAKMLKK